MKKLPDADKLNALLDYDPITGDLRWKIYCGNNAKAGDIVGGIRRNKDRKPYREFCIGRKRLTVFRVVWKIMTGTDPACIILSKDGDNTNCKWDNLVDSATPEAAEYKSRMKTKRSKFRNNKTGYTGVTHAPKGLFRAQIYYDGKPHGLGEKFKTAEDAARAYNEEAIRVRGEKYVHPDILRGIK